MFCRPFIYIDPVGEEALKTFKYKGGSDSYLYGLVWSPLTEFLVLFLRFQYFRLIKYSLLG